jgi:L-amino acid N-acyltransferase YncA
MSLIRDSAEAFQYIQRQQGWRSAFSLAGQFARAPFYEYHRGYLLHKSLAEPIQVPASGVSESIRQLDLDNVALLETIMPPLRVKRIAKKLQAREACCVAIRDGKVIAYVLAGLANTPSTNDANLQLSDEQAYLWAGYALPQFRRQGVVREVNLSLCRHLQKRGYKSAILLVEKHNEASLGHCYKMGYDMRDKITYLRILRWKYSKRVPFAERYRGERSTR